MAKYLMCIFTPNTEFLSLILWLGGLFTETDTEDDDNYAR